MSFWDRQESISRLRWASPVATVTDVAYGITAHAEAMARRMRAGCAAEGSWFVPSASGESCVVWKAAVGAVRRAGAWVQAVPWLFRMPLGELAWSRPATMPAGGGAVCQWASWLTPQNTSSDFRHLLEKPPAASPPPCRKPSTFAHPVTLPRVARLRSGLRPQSCVGRFHNAPCARQKDFGSSHSP